MEKYHIKFSSKIDYSYMILIGEDLFNNLVEDLLNDRSLEFNKIAIITDSKVDKLYGEKLLNLLRINSINVEKFVFPSGEKWKNREIKAEIEDQMIDKSFGKDSLVIALGGGLVSDLAGFIASTYCRGIPYINYSTTFLAAADASIGGKTAVNTPVATNLIGNYHQPERVYIDIKTWNTLSIRQIRNGLAETIKHACIYDRDFFDYLMNNINRIIENDQLIMDKDIMKYIAKKNCAIKNDVVMHDYNEMNLRQVLNFGHTFGRAIEILSNYKLLHGEAIVLGMMCASRLSNELGLISDHELNEIEQLFKNAGFNLKFPNHIDSKTLINKMHTDKKVRNGQIRVVLLSKIGEVKQFNNGLYSTEIDENLIEKVILTQLNYK